jgi:predicted ribosome quality control (RQC) complex YloA/Tae2 family protein
MAPRKGPPPPSDPDAGIHHGRQVARRFTSPDGMVVLVGLSAADNDVLTFKLAAANDFWLHVASQSGSHVVVRNPEGVSKLPRDTQRFAASLAARHSKGRAGGKVGVHLTRVRQVSKGQGRPLPAGKVVIGRYDTITGVPAETDGVEAEPAPTRP